MKSLRKRILEAAWGSSELLDAVEESFDKKLNRDWLFMILEQKEEEHYKEIAGLPDPTRADWPLPKQKRKLPQRAMYDGSMPTAPSEWDEKMPPSWGIGELVIQETA